jgi:aminoglycoside 3-N-acetyltransferase
MNSDKQKVSKTDFVEGMRELGAGPGEVVMAHSSLSAFGWVDGGADTVIEGVIESVAPDGTVVFPTLCQRDKERRFETWDIDTSPSDVGRMTEVFRLRPDTRRSDHPTHSVAAVGPMTDRIISGHATADGRPGPWGPAAFGHGSPWDVFYELDIVYCFLGVTFSCNTMRHYIQSRLVEEAIAAAPEGEDAAEDVRGWRKEGVWPDYKGPRMQKRLTELGLITQAQIGGATCYSIRARQMVDSALAILREEADEWFAEDFVNWYYWCLRGAAME